MQRKTISGIPGWLEAGVADYQAKHEIQSWSQSILELAIRGLIHAAQQSDDVEAEGFFGGSLEDEAELFEAYDEAQEAGFKGSFEDWLITSLQNTWGGERKAGK